MADGQCARIRELLAQAQVPVLWLEAGCQPLEAVSAALAARRRRGQAVQSLHWVSHGGPGVLQLGALQLDRQVLLAAREALAGWGIASLSLWSCHAGADRTFINLWEELTGACVWSSDQLLGRTSTASANWQLSATGHAGSPRLPVDAAHLLSWPHQLNGSASAPVASGSPSLAAVTENTTSPPGDTVANLFGSAFSDADADTLQGVAITANNATPDQGAWDYSVDNGNNWSAVATTGLSDATALYLDAASKLRFVPAANYTGSPGGLTARLVDSSFVVRDQPAFQTSTTNPFGLTTVGTRSTPVFADLDGNGVLDLFVGNGDGNTTYFENTGTSANPVFSASTTNPFGITDVGANASPTFADVDGNGNLDLFIGSKDGNIAYFENTGTPASPSFASASLNPFGVATISGLLPGAYPTFADLDGNGNLDLFVGAKDGSIHYFENTGTASTPAFAASSVNPFGLSSLTGQAKPVFVDLDDDGDLDLFAGDGAGNIVYFENTGTSTSPAFTASSSNPFGITPLAAGNANPAFADLDGNGILDLFVGSNDGNVVAFTNAQVPDHPPVAGSTLDVSTHGGSTAFSSTALLLATSVVPPPQAAAATPAAALAPVPPPVVDDTPADPAPAGVNIQPTDSDGDGLREVITASDGLSVDGNRDGVADAEQSQVAGLRLINDGALASDYGAISVSAGLQLSAVMLNSESSGWPDGITNVFAGEISFSVSGLAPGGSTEATIHLPTGLFVESTAAYIRFNYLTNQFEEFLDTNGDPLYSFQDSNSDGFLDAVVLRLVDGDPRWDGDGEANGTVVDPGFLGTGARRFTGGPGTDILTGNVLANEMDGQSGEDTLLGHEGDDVLRGGKGKDHLYGGEGADVLIGGKKWRDIIMYFNAAESTASRPDTVKFHRNDRFDFSAFDGNSVAEGRQSLHYIGHAAFTGSAGELRSTPHGLFADTTGDAEADFVVTFFRPSRFFSHKHLLL